MHNQKQFDHNSGKMTGSSSLRVFVAALVCVLFAGGGKAHAQTTASVDGTVRDVSGALVPGATVTVVSEKSKSKRVATSNGHGDFSVEALPPDTYDLIVTSKGFDTYRVNGIDLHPGDRKTIARVQLKLGEVSSEVTVTATEAGVELDSPEKSALITADDISRLSTVGRDATELIRMLPGFAVSTGGGLGNAATSQNGQTMGFGSSSVSQYSANGATPQTGATTVMSDGASAMDPGDMGASIQNVNMDMVQEIKVQTSNFGADSAKGPVVINAVGKSGGANFHGTAYLLARNGVLNANDWYSNYEGAFRPPTSYFFPGGNIGGPILIPGTNFNHNKKLRFFSGFEFYKQTLFTGLLQAFIPSKRMLGGDLTPASIAQALNVTPSALVATCPNFYTTNGGGTGAPTLNGLGGVCYSPGMNGTTYTQQDQLISSGVVVGGNGLLPVDPRALIYAKFWPTPNRTPQASSSQNLLSDGINYQDSLTNSANGYQFQFRVDDDLTDTTKLSVTYKLEDGNYEEKLKNEFYSGALGATIPYPTPEYSHTKSNGLNLNITKTFGASLTNEFLATGILFNEPAQFGNPGLVQDSNTGWTGGRYYNNGAHQLPGIVDYETGVPDFAMAYDPLGTGKFLRKFSYNFADNVTKQIGAHTAKVGIYFETIGNNQVPYNFTQGENAFNHYNAGCETNDGLHVSQLQNNIANFLQGCTAFNQSSASIPENLRYRSLESYVQDDWKATRRLTLQLSIRFQHVGAWYSPDGLGMAAWTPPAQHVVSAVTQDPHSYPGISWHQTNPAIPLSGQPTRPMFYSPRAGLSYDLHGDGKTTLRGGFGLYRFHDSYNDSAGALSTTRGTQSYTTPSNASCTYDQISAAAAGSTKLGQACVFLNGASAQTAPFTVYALDPRDDRQPVTWNYNFTVDQALYGGLLEMSYVGNQSHDVFTAGNLSNQNYIPLGGLFQPDPLTGAVTQAGSSQQIIADYRPYPNYTAVYVPSHIAYANYNSLQVSYNKRKGAFIFTANYTWSKALGIHGDYRNGASSDPSSLVHNYGYLGFNRNNIVNATYSWQVGRIYRRNRYVGDVINNWEFSGITNLQSGPDIAVLTGGGNFGLSAAVSYTLPGTSTPIPISTGNTAFLGTPDIPLQPVVNCDPRINLHSDPKLGKQFFNGSCFGLPPYGSNGTFDLPDVHGPAYFQSDLTVKRQFNLRDKRNVVFSAAAFNLLNHPLYSFAQGPNIGLNLVFGLNGYVATSPQDAFAHAVQTSSNFGYTPYKQGYRIVELGARYNF